MEGYMKNKREILAYSTSWKDSEGGNHTFKYLRITHIIEKSDQFFMW